MNAGNEFDEQEMGAAEEADAGGDVALPAQAAADKDLEISDPVEAAGGDGPAYS